jgi:tetratricopeptide (TPR) repeat protein
MKKFGWMWQLIVGVLSVLFLAANVAAQTADPAKAGEALEKGLAAAKANQFPLALEYLTAAQKADPDRSDIWFNLALASSKIPGHEFRAIALFEAYLLDQPKSPKRQAIEKLLNQLGLPIEARILAILDELKAMDASFADHEALAGYAERAHKTLTEDTIKWLLPGESMESERAARFGSFAWSLARAGLVSQAESYLAQFENWIDQQQANAQRPVDDNFGAYLQLAFKGLMADYVRQHNLAKATALYAQFKRRIPVMLEIAREPKNSYVTEAATEATSMFACLQSHAGDAAGAHETLNHWREAVMKHRPSEPEGSAKSSEATAMEIIAEAQHFSGDEVGANATGKQGLYDMITADKYPGSVNPDFHQDRQDLMCWLPNQRKRNLLYLGLHGFEPCEESELDVAKCVSRAKAEDQWKVTGLLGRLAYRVAGVYEDIKYRGKGWDF